MSPPSSLRPRGARPTPRAKLCGAMPHRIRGATPATFAVIPSRLSYWLNNETGDCVTAEEAFAKACSNPEIFIEDATVQTWATQNGVMNGADLLQVIQAMEQSGFQQGGDTYNDGSSSSVDFTNAAVLQNAISQGPVKIGVAANQLEQVVGTTNGWFGIGFKHDTNEDHCVSLCGYGPLSWLAQQLGVSVPANVDGAQPGYLLFTWDTIGVIDVPSMIAITGEAWLRTPTTIVVGPKPTPAPIPPGPTPPAPVTPPLFSFSVPRAIPKGVRFFLRAPVALPVGNYDVTAHAGRLAEMREQDLEGAEAEENL